MSGTDNDTPASDDGDALPPKGKDRRGRFTKGNVYAGQYHGGANAHNFRRAMMETVSEDDVKQITQIVVKRARRGDVRCIELLWDRLMGKPRVNVELDVNATILDVDQIRQRLRALMQADPSIRALALDDPMAVTGLPAPDDSQP